MPKSVFIFAIVLFVNSCSSTKEKPGITAPNLKEIRLVVKPDSIITKISEIASDIEYIPLQTSGKTNIKAVDKIILNDNKIYLSICTDILCFDRQGRFLKSLYNSDKIDSKLMVWIENFAVDSADTSLVVLSGNNLLYFKDNGSGFFFVRMINLGRLHPLLIDFVPGTTKMISSSFRKNGLELALHFLLDLNGDTISCKPNYFKRFNPVYKGFRDQIFHFRFDNRLYVRERFNDTIFSLNNGSNEFIPEYIISSWISSTNKQNLNDPGYFSILPRLKQLFETSGYIYYIFNWPDKDHKVFYYKKEGKRYEIDPVHGVLKDDIAGGPDFEPEFCDDNIVYYRLYAPVLKRYCESRDFSNKASLDHTKKAILKKMALSLKETDNPVLVSVKLKY
jgi:hypothetical protein